MALTNAPMTSTSSNRRQKYVIGGLMLLFNLLYGVNFAALGPILPLIRDDYGVSRGQAGLLVTLSKEEILDLLAFLISQGNAKHKIYGD